MHQNQNSYLLCSMSSHQQTRNFFIQIRSVATKTIPATHMANPVQLQHRSDLHAITALVGLDLIVVVRCSLRQICTNERNQRIGEKKKKMKWRIFVVWVEDWRLEKIRSLLICVIWFRGIDQQVSFGQVTPSLVRKRRTIAQIWVFISLSLVPNIEWTRWNLDAHWCCDFSKYSQKRKSR